MARQLAHTDDADITLCDLATFVTARKLSSLAAADAPVAFAGQQATGLCVENRTSDPPSPAVGQIWLRTDL